MRRTFMPLFKPFRNARAYLAMAVFCLVGAPRVAMAYTVVQAASNAPAGLEASFIASTTAQFEATVYTNPFFPGTYQVLLLSPNTSYQQPINNEDLLNALIETSTHTYEYGFADGLDQQRNTDTDIALDLNCSSMTALGWLSTQSTGSPTCAADMAAAAASINVLAGSCASQAQETAVFGSSITAVVNTVGCGRILPFVANYVANLAATGCSTTTVVVSTLPTTTDLYNCNLVSKTISDSIYNTEYDSSTWLSPSEP